MNADIDGIFEPNAVKLMTSSVDIIINNHLLGYMMATTELLGYEIGYRDGLRFLFTVYDANDIPAKLWKMFSTELEATNQRIREIKQELEEDC